METTEQLTGSWATPSRSGQLLACIANGKLRIHYTQAPERYLDLKTRVQPKDVIALKWSNNSAFVAILSPQLIEVLSLDDDAHRIRIDNGSGGLGRFASADFVGDDHLLVIWEFGKTKLWNLANGKGTELGELKTRCEGRNWAMRPKEGGGTETLALLSRVQAQDQLTLHLPASEHSMPPQLLSSTDARGLSWSPDGRWLAVLDTAHADPSLLILTPDGHKYRSYPATQSAEGSTDLGIKAIAWSGDSSLLAVSRYDHTMTLLNTRTFTPVATIEHSTTIAPPVKEEELISAWQESVSPSNTRSYTVASLPLSPPLSRAKPSVEPAELGVAEACFSADGRHLATRDERMLNTVWIWDINVMRAKAVLLQHSNVRRMHWHPLQTHLLMLDCGESMAYLFDASSDRPPSTVHVSLPATPTFSFLTSPLLMTDDQSDTKPTILANTKTTFCLVYPEGKSEIPTSNGAEHAAFEEGASEDSLLEVLTGKKPAPPRTEPSYTEMVDLAAETEEDTVGLDDTFREKKKADDINGNVPDPFDDSEIF